MTVSDAQAVITKAVSAWEGVTVQPYRFSGVEYVIGRREIAQLWRQQLVNREILGQPVENELTVVFIGQIRDLTEACLPHQIA